MTEFVFEMTCDDICAILFQFYYYIIECIHLKYNFEWPQQGEFG